MGTIRHCILSVFLSGVLSQNSYCDLQSLVQGKHPVAETDIFRLTDCIAHRVNVGILPLASKTLHGIQGAAESVIGTATGDVGLGGLFQAARFAGRAVFGGMDAAVADEVKEQVGSALPEDNPELLEDVCRFLVILLQQHATTDSLSKHVSACFQKYRKHESIGDKFKTHAWHAYKSFGMPKEMAAGIDRLYNLNAAWDERHMMKMMEESTFCLSLAYLGFEIAIHNYYADSMMDALLRSATQPTGAAGKNTDSFSDWDREIWSHRGPCKASCMEISVAHRSAVWALRGYSQVSTGARLEEDLKLALNIEKLHVAREVAFSLHPRPGGCLASSTKNAAEMTQEL